MDITGIKRGNLYLNYDMLSCVSICLFEGKTVKSDAGEKTIKDRYYQFMFENKRDKKDVQTVRCGYPTAREICDYYGQDLPTEFNVFAAAGGGAGGAVGHGHVNWNPARRQLYNAIMLMVTRFNMNGGIIIEILAEVKMDPEDAVSNEWVKSVNTIMDKYRTSMPEIIAYFARHGDVRRFRFDELKRIMLDVYGMNHTRF